MLANLEGKTVPDDVMKVINEEIQRFMQMEKHLQENCHNGDELFHHKSVRHAMALSRLKEHSSDVRMFSVLLVKGEVSCIIVEHWKWMVWERN